jgi:hypothetical protein
VNGAELHLNVEKAIAQAWTMDRDERSLILFFETCAVDRKGAVDSRRMNRDDFKIAERWNEEGFIRFGRIKGTDVTETRSHWVSLTEPAWQAAHLERRARASRSEARRGWGKNPPRKGGAS